jgi:hypothetical protein
LAVGGSGWRGVLTLAGGEVGCTRREVQGWPFIGRHVHGGEQDIV